MRKRSLLEWSRQLGVHLAFVCAVLSAAEGRADPVARQQLAEGVTFEVNALRRVNDNVLQMDFTVVNDTSKTLNPETLGLGMSGHMNGVNLLDMQGLKLYKVGFVSGVGCLCSKTVPVPANGRQTFYAQYAAPPPEVTKLAIQFAVAPPIFGVPIGP